MNQVGEKGVTLLSGKKPVREIAFSGIVIGLGVIRG